MSKNFTELYRQVDAKAAANFLDLSTITLEKMRRTGDGPRFVRIAHNCVRYRLKDLIEYQEARLQENNASLRQAGRG